MLLTTAREAITDPNACFVDQGYGSSPRTTLETLTRWRHHNPALFGIGVEIDADRVARATPFADDSTQFFRGGFDVKLPRPATLLRAMNVLRQYDEEDVSHAWRCMGRNLANHGILVEGTCDPWGRILVVNILQRLDDTLVPVSLVFSTNFRDGFHPSAFQARLPKNLIHRMIPGEPIHAFLADWTAAFDRCVPWIPYGPRAVFFETARVLAETRPLDMRRQLLRRGVLRVPAGSFTAPIALSR